MAVAVIKKNNKVKFKIQTQAALALGMLNLGPSKPLLPTVPPPVQPVQWTNPPPPLRSLASGFWPDLLTPQGRAESL